ncbi:MAG TPA: AI-2E family transporter [Planctomycetota bacterium]|nr:AI-2E family transporter [Planctomycetota bacterium]
MEPAPLRSRATPWFVFCTAVAALYFGRDFLTPIALAAFIAFLLAPSVRILTRWRIPRVVSTTLVLGWAAILVIGLGWLLLEQLSNFAEDLPRYVVNLRAKFEDLRATYGNSIEQASSTVRALGGDVGQEPGAPPPAPAPASASSMGLSIVRAVIGSLAVFGATAAFVFLLSWVMLVGWDDLRDRALELAGRSDLYVTTRAAGEASAKVTRYVRKQILVNSLHGTVLGLLLFWIGVPNPLVWGILAAALRFIPYLGPMISTLAPIVVALASSEGWSQTWMTAAALIGLELVTNNIVEPWVYGSSTGISTLAILVSAAFWTWVWGVIGLALSTPLTVCLLVLGKNFPRLRFFEVLIGDEPAMPERSRLYHRMLAGAQDEAWDILRNRAKQEGELMAADRLLLPALSLAGQAVREGTIGPEQRDMIASLTHTLVGELEDSRVPDEAPLPRETPRILCVVARDAFDAVGCRLLAAELERRGCGVSQPGENELFAETLARIRVDPPQVVCVSSVVPTHFLHVRALCKRLMQASPEVHIVLGLWGEDLEQAEIEQRLPASARIHVVTSLADAADQAAALAEVPGATKQLRTSSG